MKIKSLLKSIIVLGLSLILVLTFTNYVFANNEYDWEDAINANNSNLAGNSLNNGTNSLNNGTNSLNNGTNSLNNGTNSLNNGTNSLNNRNNSLNNGNTNSNRNTNNTNSNGVSSNALADTGIGSTGAIIAILLIIGVFIAIYSYKKIDEYRSL